MSLIRALDNGSISKYCLSGHHLRFTLWSSGLALIVLLTSCNSKKYLTENQSFLKKNKITIKSHHPVPNKSDLYENLSTLYQQKQTKKILPGYPRHITYYQYQKSLAKNPDRKKWNEERLIKNRPVIFDSLKAQQTIEVFEHYLAIRGYRSAVVSYKTKPDEDGTIVSYQVDPGPRIYLDTFLIVASDSSIQEIMDQSFDKTFIPPQSPLDIELYSQERKRVVRLLQNEGYATFDESYISTLEVDSSNQRVKAVMRLVNPSDSTFHQKYYVGDIAVYADYDVATTRYYDTLVRDIKYYLPDTPVFTLKPEAIEKNMFIHSGEETQRDNLERTVKNLGRIELIKSVNPDGRFNLTSIDTPSIDYFFYLTRNKKINFDFNAELTYSNIASEEKKSLFGTSLGASYRDRNIFKGAEILNINAEVGFDFNFFNKQSTSEQPLLNSLNFGLGGNLSFPRFIDPLGIYGRIGRTRNPDKKALIGDRLHQWLEEEASTRLSLGISYVKITDLYEYRTLNANLNYDIQPNPFNKLTINRIGFDLFIPIAEPAYQEILDTNKFLAESFGNQLYTGLFFRNYLQEINSKSKTRTGYFKILHSAELSGIEMFLINSGINSINNNNKEIVLNPNRPPKDQVKFSQFLKGEMDLRYYRDFTRNTQLSCKFNIGMAAPYGPYTNQVPYPKQFFVGGALSNRAWQIRELGPGGYEDTLAHDPSLPFYQTGDFKIDMSAELRFKLVWYFEGAVFLDAANVWILDKDEDDPSRDAAALDHFIDEFGVGYGLGLRLDVEFFLLRLDFGFKLHYPYGVNADGTGWARKDLARFPNGGEPQIAVGLPF